MEIVVLVLISCFIAFLTSPYLRRLVGMTTIISEAGLAPNSFSAITKYSAESVPWGILSTNTEFSVAPISEKSISESSRRKTVKLVAVGEPDQATLTWKPFARPTRFSGVEGG